MHKHFHEDKAATEAVIAQAKGQAHDKHDKTVRVSVLKAALVEMTKNLLAVPVGEVHLAIQGTATHLDELLNTLAD